MASPAQRHSLHTGNCYSGKGKHGTRRPAYLNTFPLATVPSIEDNYGDSRVVRISEAPAIIAYLSEKHGWSDIYPADIVERSRMDEYCLWHHNNLRSITKAYFRTFTIPHPLITEDVTKLFKKQANTSLKIIENSYLGSSSSGYLLDTDQPTAADFMAYEEVAQIPSRFGNIHNLEEFPKIRS